MFRKCFDHGVAAAWGSAEALVFFIVPDVWTSWLALHNPRRGITTTLSALAGAPAGGAANYKLSDRMRHEDTPRGITPVPGTSSDITAAPGRGLDETGWSVWRLVPTEG